MPTWHDGFMTRAQVVASYGGVTGFDVSHAAWYHVFNVFRFAAIIQQIYKRYDAGQTHDERFREIGNQANARHVASTLTHDFSGQRFSFDR